jgi:hypothetical protein
MHLLLAGCPTCVHAASEVALSSCTVLQLLQARHAEARAVTETQQLWQAQHHKGKNTVAQAAGILRHLMRHH